MTDEAPGINTRIPMTGQITLTWNLGENEDGTVSGLMQILDNGRLVSDKALIFGNDITDFSDDELENAAEKIIVSTYWSDFRPRLLRSIYMAAFEIRERHGGFDPPLSAPEGEDPSTGI